MTPRRLRLGADLFTIVVIASVGVALAGLTWRVAGDPGQRLGATPVAVRTAPPPDIGLLTRLSPFGSGAADATVAAGGDAVLRGVMLASPASASAALVSIGGAVPTAFYLGQDLAGGRIVEIDADHVVLDAGGTRRILAFPDRSGDAAIGATAAAADTPNGPISAPMVASPAAAPPSPAGPAVPADAGPPASPLNVMSGFGGSPAADGLHVATPSPQMRAAGVRPGDIVQRINGLAIPDLMTNPGALQSAVANGTARIDVIRAGQPLSLSVPLH